MGGVERLPSGRYRARAVNPVTGERVAVQGTYETKASADAAWRGVEHEAVLAYRRAGVDVADDVEAWVAAMEREKVGARTIKARARPSSRSPQTPCGVTSSRIPPNAGPGHRRPAAPSRRCAPRPPRRWRQAESSRSRTGHPRWPQAPPDRLRAQRCPRGASATAGRLAHPPSDADAEPHDGEYGKERGLDGRNERGKCRANGL